MREDDGDDVPGGLESLDEGVDVGGGLVRGRAIVVHYLGRLSAFNRFILQALSIKPTRICIVIWL
jgi:hypothetical protein